MARTRDKWPFGEGVDAERVKWNRLLNEYLAPRMPGELTFLCIETPEGNWTFWCPGCHRWHFHGAIEGGREAHCLKGPYAGTQYRVKLMPPGPPPEERATTSRHLSVVPDA